MRLPPRPRDRPLLDRPLLVRAYLFLGLIEGALSLATYLFAWRALGVDWDGLRRLAPSLLDGTAAPDVLSLQHQASAAAFTTIVLGQLGVLLACRSAHQPALSQLGLAGWRANPLLLLGISGEALLTVSLITAPPLATVFAMAPFPAAWLGWMALTPLVIVLADDARKRRWRVSRAW